MKLSRQEIVMHNTVFAFNQEGWNPPLMKALEGLNDELVDWHPMSEAGGTNTIREIVTHLLFYKEQLLQRLQGIKSTEPTSNEATFKPSRELTWEDTVSRLCAVQDEILGHLLNLQDEDLDRPMPDFPIGGQMLTLSMHDVYHTGQIVILRKLQGSWSVRGSL